MELLVLGGSGFVGRAVVEDGLRRGWAVTTFNRGRRPAPPGARAITGDRLAPGDLAPLAEREWDVVVDTWSGAPWVVRDSAALLADRAGRYVYVSSESVYGDFGRHGGDESMRVVAATPDAESGAYAELKRGAELAVEAAFGGRALLPRPGLILGPHEDVGRLPWWLERTARGGEVLAPGPPEQPLQLIDARDLAAWTLDAAAAGLSGPCNAVSRPGRATMESLLDACVRVTGAGASLTWVDAAAIERAGIVPWTELPAWLPPGSPDGWLHATDVERAHAAGLRCRPVEETVADTWAWLRSLDGPPPRRTDLPPLGLDPVKEAAALTAWRAAA